MKRMKLKDLLCNAGLIQINGDENTDIGNISYDTRTADENSIFVCIKGINTDRHSLIGKAAEKKCRAIVTEYPADTGDCINVVVKNTNKALAVISSNFYGNPDKKMKIIGVTGTNGKTTSTTLIKAVLENCGYKVGLIGTNDIIIDGEAVPSDNTTPEPPS